MKNRIIILCVALIAAIVLANSETNRAPYTVNLSDIPASLRAYVEENPESFLTNMNDLIGQGYSEAEALLEMERRLAVNLNKVEAEKENARFLKEVEAVPHIQRAMVIQNPEIYKAAKRKLASGLPVTPREQGLLGIMKDGKGLYCPSSSMHPDHLRNEIAYANEIIRYDQTVNDIQSMMHWLRNNCPPGKYRRWLRSTQMLKSRWTSVFDLLKLSRTISKCIIHIISTGPMSWLKFRDGC